MTTPSLLGLLRLIMPIQAYAVLDLRINIITTVMMNVHISHFDLDNNLPCATVCSTQHPSVIEESAPTKYAGKCC